MTSAVRSDFDCSVEGLETDMASNSPWLAPFVVIDTETTGLDSDPDARICELAAILFEKGKPTDRRVATRINPGRPIPAEATKIHGISNADVIGAPTFAEAWAFVVELYDTDHTSTVAYSATFDREFARREVTRAGIARPPLGLRRPWIDPLVWVRQLDWFVRGSGRHKLGPTCERRKVELVKAHSAADDALAAGCLWLALEHDVRSFLGPKPHGIREVLRVQGALAESQQRDWQDYQRKQIGKGLVSFFEALRAVAA